jgi:AcrR family transcriptional regulator
MLDRMAQLPTKGGKRAKTRKALINAAIEEVARNGFHAASVDAIAEKAGFSIGALYGNFASKDDLLFAVFDEHVAWFEKRLEGFAGADDPAKAIAGWIGYLGRHPEQFLIFIEFWAYAVRKPKVRREFARRMAQMREAVGSVLGLSDGGDQAPVHDLGALLALATARGLAIEKLVAPAAVPDQAVGELLAGLFALWRRP